MRLAIFDGILETHLASTLEVALKRRGHEVYNTGKFGSGFRMPSPSQPLVANEQYLERVLAFQPDVILVFRPNSLPLRLIERVKKKDIVLIAWFSDDPVLFDLSYGPIVSRYDAILHCGTEKVLHFYENMFGFATGVNFPFWTSHDEFPPVWGTGDVLSDAVFLGNVHDKVRRKRYFELGKMRSTVRVHGALNTDYFGITGGYLDNNREVVESMRHSKIAINIPQFFTDHAGLDTWFTELNDLGFFEYPSRVVQYMAMGVPTVTVLPYEHKFLTYPEMTVVHSIEEVDDFIESTSLEELQTISRATVSRFDRHFSADARALALEAFLANDEWRRMDARERSEWFTLFVPDSAYDNQTPEITVDPGTNETRSGSGAFPVEFISPDHGTQEDQRIRVAVISQMDEAPLSQEATFVRALRDYEDQTISFTSFELEADDPRTVVLEKGKPNRLLSVEFVDELTTYDLVIAVGIDLEISSPATSRFRNTRTVTGRFIGFRNNLSSRTLMMFERFDFHVTTDPWFASATRRNGAMGCLVMKPFVNQSYLDLLEDAENNTDVLKVEAGRQFDESICLAYLSDVLQVNRSVDLADIDRYSLEEAAAQFKCAVALIGFTGNRAKPQVPHILPYLVVAADYAFVPRVTDVDIIGPYSDVVIQVREPGELSAKTSMLIAEEERLDYILDKRSSFIQDRMVAERAIPCWIQKEVFPMLFDRREESHQVLRVGASLKLHFPAAMQNLIKLNFMLGAGTDRYESLTLRFSCHELGHRYIDVKEGTNVLIRTDKEFQMKLLPTSPALRKVQDWPAVKFEVCEDTDYSYATISRAQGFYVLPETRK